MLCWRSSWHNNQSTWATQEKRGHGTYSQNPFGSKFSLEIKFGVGGTGTVSGNYGIYDLVSFSLILTGLFTDDAANLPASDYEFTTVTGFERATLGFYEGGKNSHHSAVTAGSMDSANISFNSVPEPGTLLLFGLGLIGLGFNKRKILSSKLSSF